MILAGSGMCTAGRILHHFKQNLWRPETRVLIVGFQPEGALGRLLIEGRKRVSIFGELIAVKAAVHSLGGFSAHAAQSDLLRWLEPLANQRPRVILTHGEARPRTVLSQRIREKHGIVCDCPGQGQRLTL
jgi:metallo-beta-lactamase family protein